jgi:hypothetical protein
MLFLITISCNQSTKLKKPKEYLVQKLSESLTVDANWEKPQWNLVQSLEIKNFMGELPSFKPVVNAKMIYDNANVYIIFQVHDQYVRSVASEINGDVWDDSCVEFFFSPDTKSPEKYFNLEVNCGGTALMRYNLIPRVDFIMLDSADIKKIEIAHSLPVIINPEIKDAVTWSVEIRIPLDVLKKYSELTKPEPGVKWKANFYKIADKTSNPHYIAWSPVINPEPDFHLPQFFGTLIFE